MKLFFALVLTFALCGPAFAQDSKVSDMTSTTTVDGNDEYLYIVEDISGTPLSRRVKPIDLIQQVTFANLPAAGTAYRLRWVTDCTSTTSCTAGGGTAKVLHFDNGTSWVPIYAIITAANVTYTPTTGADWDDPDPENVRDALDDLAAVGKLTTTSAGAPGVTDCLSTLHYIVDTSTPELYFCPSGAGSAPVKVHAKSIGVNQINGDSGSFTLPAGGGPATLSGGTGLTNTCATATCTMEIDANAITFAKMQAITDGKLLGASGGTAVEEITVGTGLSLAANTLTATGGGVAPVLRPYSAIPVTAGMVYSKVYNSEEELMHVTTATLLTSDAIVRYRFQVPQALPSGTAKARILARSNNTTGDLKLNVKWCSAAVEEATCTVTAEGTSTISWGAGDTNQRKELKVTLDADTVVAAEIIEMDFTIEDTGTTISTEVGFLVTVIWE